MGFLSKIRASDLIKERNYVESIQGSESVSNAIVKMGLLKVLSLPVVSPLLRAAGVDEEPRNAYVGFISMWDIVHAIWFRLESSSSSGDHENKASNSNDNFESEEAAVAARLFREKYRCRLPADIEAEDAVNSVLQGSVKDLLKAAAERSLFSPMSFIYPASITLDHLLDAFSAQRGLHRVLLHTDNRYVLVSQSDSVRVLIERTKEEEVNRDSSAPPILSLLMNKTLAQLGMNNSVVYKILPHEPTVHALRLMAQHQVRAVAVVDEQDRLVGTFSSSDLRGLNPQTIVSSLWLPAKEFLHFNSSAQLTCSLDDSLLNVATKMVQNKVHRLWLCDEERRVTGVVALADVLRYVKKAGETSSRTSRTITLAPSTSSFSAMRKRPAAVVQPEKTFLQFPTADIIIDRPKVYTVSSRDTVEIAIAKMGAMRVLSLPVTNVHKISASEQTQVFIGFISMWDIVHTIWFRLQENDAEAGEGQTSEIVSSEAKAAAKLWRQRFHCRFPDEIAAEKAVQDVVHGTVGDLLKFVTNMSIFSPLTFVYPGDVPFEHLLEVFSAQRGLHRVLLRDEGQHFVVSQSDVVRVLLDCANEEQQHQAIPGAVFDYCRALDCANVLPCSIHSAKAVLLPIMSKTIDELGLTKPTRAVVYKIRPEEPTVNALKLMSEHNVHAIAVVDSEDILVGTFSASNLRGLNTHMLVSSLWLPAKQFLTLGPQFSCHPQDTLGTVTACLVRNKIHRLWVCDHEGRVLSVVTLTDVISRCRTLALTVAQNPLQIHYRT